MVAARLGVVVPPAPPLHLYAPRVAIIVSRRLRYLHCALPTYASCRSRLPYCGILCCRRRNHAAPPCAADPPSRPYCSLRSSRRYDDDLHERRLCHTAPSRYVSPLRFSTTACRLRRRCVTRHPTRYRFIATPAYRAAYAARSFSTPLRYRSRLGLKFYLGDVSSADHLAFKFYDLISRKIAITRCLPTSKPLAAA